MPGYYLGIDQGTTGTTVLLLDEDWNLAAKGYREHKQYYPAPGWVEQDALALWECLGEAVRQALRYAGALPAQIRCIGLDHQGETVVVWDKATGKPVCPAIVWQDRRTSARVEEI